MNRAAHKGKEGQGSLFQTLRKSLHALHPGKDWNFYYVNLTQEYRYWDQYQNHHSGLYWNRNEWKISGTAHASRWQAVQCGWWPVVADGDSISSARSAYAKASVSVAAKRVCEAALVTKARETRSSCVTRGKHGQRHCAYSRRLAVNITSFSLSCFHQFAGFPLMVSSDGCWWKRCSSTLTTLV